MDLRDSSAMTSASSERTILGAEVENTRRRKASKRADIEEEMDLKQKKLNTNSKWREVMKILKDVNEDRLMCYRKGRG